MHYVEGLASWRAVRNITKPQTNYPEMTISELSEISAANGADDWSEQVDGYCDVLVLAENQSQLELGTTAQTIHSSNDTIYSHLSNYEFGANNAAVFNHIASICFAQLRELGVIPGLAMKQCVKHISSRRIDPSKEADFLSGKLQKWPKDPNQTDVYQPNYELARSKSS